MEKEQMQGRTVAEVGKGIRFKGSVFHPDTQRNKGLKRKKKSKKGKPTEKSLHPEI